MIIFIVQLPAQLSNAALCYIYNLNYDIIIASLRYVYITTAPDHVAVRQKLKLILCLTEVSMS